MSFAVILTLAVSVSFAALVSSHGDHSPHDAVPMSSRSVESERHHIDDHLGDFVGNVDDLSPDELRFLYFKMHDSDGNAKLDGRELVDSLLHFHHVEEGPAKIFKSDELADMIDPILKSDDTDTDGFIDYQEFVSAQKTRGF